MHLFGFGLPTQRSCCHCIPTMFFLLHLSVKSPTVVWILGSAKCAGAILGDFMIASIKKETFPCSLKHHKVKVIQELTGFLELGAFYLYYLAFFSDLHTHTHRYIRIHVCFGINCPGLWGFWITIESYLCCGLKQSHISNFTVQTHHWETHLALVRNILSLNCYLYTPMSLNLQNLLQGAKGSV